MYHYAISGIQGSGKGTQATKLSAMLDLVHISTGDWCRWHLKNQTIYSYELDIINQGGMVPDALIIELVQKRLDWHDPLRPFLLDGFPRTRPQADYLFKHYHFAAIVHLDLPTEVAMERALNRVEGGAARADDTHEALLKRFSLYREFTQPLLDFYDKQNILHVIDGRGSIEEVFKKIMDSLNARGAVAMNKKGY